jgi:hypothetical protein
MIDYPYNQGNVSPHLLATCESSYHRDRNLGGRHETLYKPRHASVLTLSYRIVRTR